MSVGVSMGCLYLCVFSVSGFVFTYAYVSGLLFIDMGL